MVLHDSGNILSANPLSRNVQHQEHEPRIHQKKVEEIPAHPLARISRSDFSSRNRRRLGRLGLAQRKRPAPILVSEEVHNAASTLKTAPASQKNMTDALTTVFA